MLKVTVKSLRKGLGMTQAQFAAHADISLRTLQSWESGARTCPAAKLNYLMMLVGGV